MKDRGTRDLTRPANICLWSVRTATHHTAPDRGKVAGETAVLLTSAHGLEDVCTGSLGVRLWLRAARDM
jgi:hypothetical protein